MRVLLLGAGGMLGRDLAALAPPCVELVGRDHRRLDVTDAAALEREMETVRPEVVVNAAGYTQVDRAESERETAFAVNGTAPGSIGRAGARLGSLVIHFSTDYVLCGRGRTPLTEDAPTEPLSAYAASKLEGERALAATGTRYLIIRSQWLFGLHGPSFPRTMWKRAATKEPTPVVNDQFGRPTYTVDLAKAVWQLVEAETTGVIHVANSGIATWYDVARRTFERAGVADLVTPCTTAEYPLAARRPAWSVLDTTRYERLTGSPLPAWEDALDRFLAALRDTAGSGTGR